MLNENTILIEIGIKRVKMSNQDSYCDYNLNFIPASEVNTATNTDTKSINLGTRDNTRKLRWRNIPRFLIKPLVDVGVFGEGKYNTFNFLKGFPTLDTMDSLERHLDKFYDPDQSDYDDESGCHHLAHVAWNALVALYHLEKNPKLDDRFKNASDLD